MSQRLRQQAGVAKIMRQGRAQIIHRRRFAIHSAIHLT